jgi:hypothetical protein
MRNLAAAMSGRLTFRERLTVARGCAFFYAHADRVINGRMEFAKCEVRRLYPIGSTILFH